MSRLNKSWQAGDGKPALATELHRVLAVSHRQAKGIIDAGCVKVDGQEARTHGQRLPPGAKVTVDYDPGTTYTALPPPRKQLDEAGFKILWEDKHLVFVDKPAGLLTVPSEKGREACLAEAITDHYRRRGFKRFQLYIVHRLDRYSSGVLVFAKTPEALHGLKALFEEHHLHRVYKAILVGEIPENAGTLTGKLVEHAKSLKMSVVHPSKGEPKGAKHAITHYRVLERLPGYTVVEVKLETGRRNQIRVQFADRGFPLLGDQVYGEASPILDRQALHAELLGFRHPVTEESLTITAPLPPDMESALRRLRTQRRVERAEAGIQGEEGIYRPKITKGRKFERVQRARRYAEEPEERSAERPAGRPAGRTGRPSGPRRIEGGDRPARRSASSGTRPDRKPAERPRSSSSPKDAARVTADRERSHSNPASPARRATASGTRTSTSRSAPAKPRGAPAKPGKGRRDK